MISVIVPCYNSEHTIEKCLTSLQSQTGCEIECIVVDDHSSDGTLDVIAKMITGDPRFKVIARQENMGPSHCRNVGIQHARGDYLSFLDADDWLNDNALTMLLQRTEEQNLDYCFSSHLEFIEQTQTFRPKNPYLTGDRIFSVADIFSYVNNYLTRPCEYFGLVHCWGRLFRRCIIIDNQIAFDVELEQMEDVSFNFNYLRHCKTIGYLDQYVYTHRISIRDSLGSTKGAQTRFDRKLSQSMIPLRNYLTDHMKLTDHDVMAKTSHFYTSMTIVSILRMSKTFFKSPTVSAYKKIGALVQSPVTQEAIAFYRPGESESKFLGVAIRWRLTSLALLVCLLKRKLGLTL